MKSSIVVEVVLPNGQTDTKTLRCKEKNLLEEIARKWPNYQDYTILNGSNSQNRWV